jgi:hypothetical protein
MRSSLVAHTAGSSPSRRSNVSVLGARIRLRNDLRAQSTRLRKCLRLHGFIDAVEYGGN